MKELICITCPRGCHLEVDETTLEVRGNFCPRGAVYGKNEISNPVRVVTSTVRIIGADVRMLPVKTDKAISKTKIKDVMELLKNVEVSSPVKIGQIIIPNILGTDVNIIATKEL